MTVARRKGDPGRADELFSRIVRSRGYCQYPGCESTGPFVTAHLIGRGRSATRCLEDNALSMCPSHHLLIDGWWDEKERAVKHTIGLDRYYELKRLAHDGIPGSSKNFWAGEVERLMARCGELDIDTRRKIPA